MIKGIKVNHILVQVHLRVQIIKTVKAGKTPIHPVVVLVPKVVVIHLIPVVIPVLVEVIQKILKMKTS